VVLATSVAGGWGRETLGALFVGHLLRGVFLFLSPILGVKSRGGKRGVLPALARVVSRDSR